MRNKDMRLIVKLKEVRHEAVKASRAAYPKLLEVGCKIMKTSFVAYLQIKKVVSDE